MLNKAWPVKTNALLVTLIHKFLNSK